MSHLPDLDWRKSNVLVTGANGFLGFALVSSLVERGAHVHALVNQNTYYKAPFCFNMRKVTTFPCDVSDLSKLSSLFSENTFDVVVHLAAINRNISLASPYSLWSRIYAVHTLS